MNATDMLLTMQMPASAAAQRMGKSSAAPDAKAPEADSRFRDMLQQRSQNQPVQEDKAPEAECQNSQPHSGPPQSDPPAIQQELAAAFMVQGSFIPATVPVQTRQVEALPASLAPTQPLQAQIPIQEEASPQVLQQQAKAPMAQTQSKDPAAILPQKPQAAVEQIPQAAVTEAASSRPQKLQVAQQPQGAQTGSDSQASPRQGDWEATQLHSGGAAAAKPVFQSVEYTPIKVGETPVADGESADLDQQLAKQIGETLEQGGQKVTIKLTPEHLGTMVVSLTRSQDGTLQVILQASTAKAASLLSEHTAALGSLLRGNAQSPVYVEVLQQDAPQSQQQQNQSQHQQQGAGQQQGGQQQHNQEQFRSQDFLEQLRLGMVAFGSEAG